MDISSSAMQIVNVVNLLFCRPEYGFYVRAFTAEDMAWCIHMTREQLAERQLPWDACGAALTDANAFNFSFMLMDTENKPAAACLTRFCPPYDPFPAMLNIEMVQNFHLRPSALEGNTFSLVLLVVALFMAEMRCRGLRLISPVNERVADYYIRQHGFADISGDKLILYREAEALFRELLQGTIECCDWVKCAQ